MTRRYTFYPARTCHAPSEAEFNAFMVGFMEWCTTYWPERYAIPLQATNSLPKGRAAQSENSYIAQPNLA